MNFLPWFTMMASGTTSQTVPSVGKSRLMISMDKIGILSIGLVFFKSCYAINDPLTMTWNCKCYGMTFCY